MTIARLYAVTVLGHDRPGIIAETTAALAGLGVNIEDSTMTLLRGHFAMMLVCSTVGANGPVSPRDIEHALARLTAEGDLDVSVRPVTDDPTPTAAASSWVLTVHGGDRPGIVSAVAQEVAASGGNITDLTTRLSGDLYLLVAELDLPAGADVPAVEAAIKATAQQVGVTATLRAVEADDL